MDSSVEGNTYPALHLLSLPKDVRLSILRHTGLLQKCLLPLKSSSLLSKGYKISQIGTLMRTCGTLSDEALQIYYGGNTFKIYTTRGVRQAQMLPPVAWKYIQSLSLEAGAEDDEENHGHFDDQLKYWQDACAWLATVLKYHHRDDLSFTFRFSTGLQTESELIQLLVALSVARLPALSTIRFVVKSQAFDYKPDIQHRIKHLLSTHGQALLSERFHTPKSSFPFSKLPLEIQSMVLAQTNLISEPQSANSDLCYLKVSKKSHGCCGYCGGRNYRNPPRNRYPLLAGFLTFSTDEDCFCGNQILTYSSSCRCNLQRSSPLFAVNSSIRQEALRIFYIHNPCKASGSALRVLNRLKSIHPDHLHLIKDLRINYGSSITWTEEELKHPSGYNTDDDWKTIHALFQFISTNIKLENSEIEINYNTYPYNPSGQDEWSVRDSTIVNAQLSVECLYPPQKQHLLRKFCNLLKSYGMENTTVRIDTNWWNEWPMYGRNLLQVMGPGQKCMVDELYDSMYWTWFHGES
ncbi:hypothetical protein BT63DRAFT_469447 [Microthyrium microscopicum]|uniref:Uncharacterized protein n=1 Tax=Microthyrium microscopicum TaxID=703497 RepID=A0A6A6UDW0_9PEZI|nr:hypothetical protein BT63DRAFT_469447 [Microthyrium microscopicum]